MRKRNVLETGDTPNKRLLVEEPDDFHAVCNLLEFHGIRSGFMIEEAEGYDRVRSSVDRRIRLANETHFGVVVDADSEFDHRWQSIRDVIVRLGYLNVPKVANPDGTIIRQAGKPIFGIWIMPDNQSHGALESFARLLLPPQDKLWQRAEAAVTSIPDDERLFTNLSFLKAHVHTWLAWQEAPGKPIGQAIKIGYFDGKAQIAEAFVTWIRELFEIRSTA